MTTLYEASYGSSDMVLTDNELAPGQVLRREPPLSFTCGNGCEDGGIDLTRDMAVGLRDALDKWLSAQ